MSGASAGAAKCSISTSSRFRMRRFTDRSSPFSTAGASYEPSLAPAWRFADALPTLHCRLAFPMLSTSIGFSVPALAIRQRACAQMPARAVPMRARSKSHDHQLERRFPPWIAALVVICCYRRRRNVLRAGNGALGGEAKGLSFRAGTIGES